MKTILTLSFLLLSGALLCATPEEDAAFAAATGQPPQALDLAQAEMLAAANHPRIAEAEAQALAARQQIREARSAFYPQVTANALAVGVDGETSQLAATGGLAASTVESRQSDGVTATQLLTDFGRTASLTAQARHLASSEEANAAATRAQVLRTADQAYFTVLEAQAIRRVADETVSARQLVLDRVSALAQARLKSELDVSFAKVDLDNARLLQLQASSGLDEAYARLANALGYRDARVFAVVDAQPYAEPGTDLKPLLERAFANRPEIAAATQQAEAARKFAAAQRAARYPTVEAIGGAGVSPVRDASRLDSTYAAAGVNIALPLFNGGKLSAQVDEADARVAGADHELDGLRNDVARDVRLAWLRAATGYQKIGVSESLLANASQSFDLAQARYTSGLSSIVELSGAQLNQTRAEIATATARYDFQILAAELKYQTGDFR